MNCPREKGAFRSLAMRASTLFAPASAAVARKSTANRRPPGRIEKGEGRRPGFGLWRRFPRSKVRPDAPCGALRTSIPHSYSRRFHEVLYWVFSQGVVEQGSRGVARGRARASHQEAQGVAPSRVRVGIVNFVARAPENHGRMVSVRQSQAATSLAAHWSKTGRNRRDGPSPHIENFDITRKPISSAMSMNTLAGGLWCGWHWPPSLSSLSCLRMASGYTAAPSPQVMVQQTPFS